MDPTISTIVGYRVSVSGINVAGKSGERGGGHPIIFIGWAQNPAFCCGDLKLGCDVLH